MSMTISSPVFQDGEVISVQFTCQGEGISPELALDGVPSTAKSLVLIVDDPGTRDPDAPTTCWTHWLLYNLPADTPFLAEEEMHLPAGTLEGSNSSGRTGYDGSCPPSGPSRYCFKLYALDALLPDLHEPVRSDVEVAMEGHVIADAEFTGTCRTH